jgi:hypothetical protein
MLEVWEESIIVDGWGGEGSERVPLKSETEGLYGLDATHVTLKGIPLGLRELSAKFKFPHIILGEKK